MDPWLLTNEDAEDKAVLSDKGRSALVAATRFLRQAIFCPLQRMRIQSDVLLA